MDQEREDVDAQPQAQPPPLLSNGHDGQDQADARGLGASNAVCPAPVSVMPTSRYAAYYNMCHRKRGFAIIFNHENFSTEGLRSRAGTNVDCSNLKETLKGLGFAVTVLHDLTHKEVLEYVNHTAMADHSNHDCICICVLTHGEQGLLHAKDTYYKAEKLWYPFTADRCPTLAGKPKMFILQACQGDRLDPGVPLAGRTETDGSAADVYRIPVHADFLICYSTVPGYYSWRNTTRGSWFIQALAEELRTHGKDRDILTLLTFVSQKVAYDCESNSPDSPLMHRQKQIPCITSMLTRLLIFGEK